METLQGTITFREAKKSDNITLQGSAISFLQILESL